MVTATTNTALNKSNLISFINTTLKTFCAVSSWAACLAWPRKRLQNYCAAQHPLATCLEGKLGWMSRKSLSLFPTHAAVTSPRTVANLAHVSLWTRLTGGWSLPAAAAAKSFQSCLTLCDPIDTSPPGSPIPGILQARTLEWVAISFSNTWKWKVKVKSLSRVRLLATP